MNRTAGETLSGFNCFKTSSGIPRFSVIRVAATGIKEFTFILFFWPSILKVFIRPTTPSLAEP